MHDALKICKFLMAYTRSSRAKINFKIGTQKKNFARVSLPIKLQALSLQKSSIAGGFLVDFTKYLRILFYGTLLIHIFVTKDTILLSFQFLLQGKQFYW